VFGAAGVNTRSGQTRRLASLQCARRHANFGAVSVTAAFEIGLNLLIDKISRFVTSSELPNLIN
jgi:hypothetical protein